MGAQLDDAGRVRVLTKQLDLSISPALMARADELVERVLSVAA